MVYWFGERYDNKELDLDQWQTSKNDKWEGSNPDPADHYGIIHEELPSGIKGSFSTVKENVQRGWICEKESGIDQDQIKQTILS